MLTTGIDPTRTSTVAEFKLGTLASTTASDGTKVYVYGRADGAITGAGYVCGAATLFDFAMASTTTTTPGTAGPGTQIGVAQAALADNEYGWFQVYGKGGVRTAASAAKGTQLNTTGTAGQIDDDATAGAEVINGIVLLTATGGAAAVNSDAFITYPTVGRTL